MYLTAGSNSSSSTSPGNYCFVVVVRSESPLLLDKFPD